MVSFLSVTNIFKLERLHQAANRCLSSSPISFLLSEAILLSLRATLIHFSLSPYKRAICLPTYSSILGLARHGVNQDSADRPEKLLRLLTSPCFLLLLLGRLSLLALPHLLELAFLHCGVHPFLSILPL